MKQAPPPDTFGRFLVEEGYITQQQLDVARQEWEAEGRRRRLGSVLVALTFMRQSQLLEALDRYDPEQLASQGGVRTRLQQEVLTRLKCAPLGESTDTLFVATAHPNPELVKRELAAITGKLIELRPASVNQLLTAVYAQAEDPQFEESGENVYRLKEGILRAAIDAGASDIHLESGEETVHVRFRVDGLLIPHRTLPKILERPLFSTIKNDSNMDAAESRSAQDGSFSRVHRGRFLDFRVASLPVIFGENITIRILDKEKGLLPLQELGITELETFRRISHNAEGIIVIVGPTGSGKSTTLYSTLLELDRIGRAVYTAEEPVEYRLPFVKQVQVNRKVGLGFAEITRALMRHDPDIMIVGEVRDAETAAQAVHASKTGHLVFVTLHAQSVETAASRLADLGITPLDLAYTVKGIMAQRLVRKVCPECSGLTCENCFFTGYRGRTLITEMAHFHTPEDFKRLLDGQLPYRTIKEDAHSKILSGVTTQEEIERVLGETLDV